MIDAIYYDGMNSRRHPVTLVIQKRVVAMRGAGVRRNERMSKMAISERFEHAPRILRFPDGAFIEASDHRQLDKMLKDNRFKDSLVVRWQNNWPLSLLALALLVLMLMSGWQWGVPAVADRLAQRLPPSFGKMIGDEGFAAMNKKMLTPSKLPLAYQQQLRARFAAMAHPGGARIPYQLEFRGGLMGANAFALPNGVIVITDQMIKLVNDDQAILGVLSHELGHIKRLHSSRNLLQSTAIGIGLNMWVGDISSALVAVPVFLKNQSNSRDFEREADRYAIDMMLANGLPLEPMALMFENMSHKVHAAAQVDEDDEASDSEEEQEPEPAPRRRGKKVDFFSSHPTDAERVATLRAAAAQAAAGTATK